MSDDVVTEVARRVVTGAMSGLTTPSMVDAIVDGLAAAGLFVSRERDRAVAARALRKAADALPSLTEDEGREGIRTWRQTVRDAYSIAVEESQSALHARADRIEAGEASAYF